MHLPIEDYFAHAYNLTEKEIWIRDSIVEWLPDTIIDAHAHCNLKSHVVEISEHALGHMLSTFPYFSLEASKKLHTMFFPGKTVRSLRFPKTFRGLDHRAANEYLLTQSSRTDRIALFGLPEDIEYTNKMLRHPRVSALKMYWSYVEPPAQVIYDFFRPEILEEAQALDVPLVLHLPKMIVRSIEDLKQVTLDFPQLRIVLAHLGLSKTVVPGLEDAIKVASKHEGMFMDTALNPSADVMSIALRCFGTKRIMFGSDEPLNLIRSVAYRHPTLGERIVTDYPYHWVDSDEFAEYGHLAQGAVHAHWQSVQAIKDAIDQLGSSERQMTTRQIFHDTAVEVYGF